MKLDLDLQEAQKKTKEMIRANFYLDKAIYARFQKECEKQGIVMSKLLQQFMQAFTDKK